MDTFEELKRIITNEKLDDKAKEFYLSNISTLDKEKQKSIIDLVVKMNNAGFKNNIPAAYSEVTENIPQFARMSVFKEMQKIVRDIEGNPCIKLPCTFLGIFFGTRYRIYFFHICNNLIFFICLTLGLINISL